MKIIISPAKIQEKRAFNKLEGSALIFPKITKKIHNTLKTFSKNDLEKIMK